VANFFRADQVGSLVKPPALVAAEAAFDTGTLDAAGLAAAQDLAVREAITLQKGLGLTFVTDGEMRRLEGETLYSSAIRGIQRRSGRSSRGGASAWQSPYCVAADLQQEKRLSEHELSSLRSLTKLPTKISLLAPSALALRLFEPGVTEPAYPTLGELGTAFGQILQSELQALIGEGARYVQLSCPAYAWLYDEQARSHLELPGQQLESLFETLFAVDVQMLEALQRSAATALGLHIPRAVAADPAATTFERMLETVLSRAPVDRFLLEYGEPQPHDFSSLHSLPQGKIAALGLVSTDSEPQAVGPLIERIEEASCHTDESNLGLSPRRGFANDSRHNPEVCARLQRRSLERTTEVVQQIWGLEF
jgi:5-methyltetrahydropteroyltriglutamate--homocysteine methyltransferase